MNLSIYEQNRSGGIEAVLFDLDGVLIETEWETFIFYQRYLKEQYDIHLPDGAFQFKAGRKSADFWRDALTPQQKNIVDTEKLTMLKRDEFNAHPDAYIKKVSGGKELLTAIRVCGWKTALVTQNEEQMMQTVLKWLGIASFFDAKLSLKDIKKKKPDPEIYLKAACLLGINPSRCVVIEDSEDGVNAAKAAGIPCIVIRHPYTPTNHLQAADAQVQSLSEINLELMEKIGRQQKSGKAGAALSA